MTKSKEKRKKLKLIGGFLGAVVLIGVIGFTLIKFDFIDSNIFFNNGGDLSKEVYYKEVSKKNVKYSDGILYADNQVSLIANEGVKKRDIKKLAKQYDAEIIGYIKFTRDYQLEFSEEKSYEELNSIVSELERNPNVESASLYRVSKVNTNEFYPSNDNYSGESWDQANPEGNNWGVEAIQAPSAWDLRDEMSEVKIGLIDTNVDSDHEDLQFEKVWNSEYENTDFKHGTSVAGIMGAKFDGNKSSTQTGITGVCPKPILYAASNGSEEYTGYMSIKCNLSRLILNNVKVINCSFGYDDLQIAAIVDSENQKVKDTLDYLNKDMTSFLNKFIDEGYDFLIVKSAGNKNGYYYKKVEESYEHQYGIEISSEKKSGFKKCKNIDAQNDVFSNITDEDLKSRIVVVGSDTQYKNGYALSDFSSKGNRIDILAPGENVYSTLPNNNYGSLQGTSMSAPYVSGLAGMIYGINGDLSASQVKKIIINTSTIDVENTNKNMINARMAVELAKIVKNEEKNSLNEKGVFLYSVSDAHKDKINDTEKEENIEKKEILKDVKVTLKDKDGNNIITLNSDTWGEGITLIDPGVYDIAFEKEGYESSTLKNIEIRSDNIVYEEVLLEKVSKVTAKIVNENGDLLERASISFKNSDENISVKSDSTGKFSKELKQGTYTVVVSKKGYETKEMTIEVDGDQKDLGEIVLSKEQNYIGYWGCDLIYFEYDDTMNGNRFIADESFNINIKSISENKILFDYIEYYHAGDGFSGTVNKNIEAVIDNGKVEFDCIVGILMPNDNYNSSSKNSIYNLELSTQDYYRKEILRFYLRNGKVYVDIEKPDNDFSGELIKGGQTKEIVR